MKKIRKGKILAGGLFALAGIAVGGVGFSSWVVQINHGQDTDPVTVAVANTSDKSVNIFEAKVSDGYIRFDGTAPTGDGDIDSRLSYAVEKDGDNNLPASLDFAVTYYVATQSTTNVTNIDAQLTLISKKAKYDNFVGTEYADDRYVLAPIAENGHATLVESGMVASADTFFGTGVTPSLAKISTVVTTLTSDLSGTSPGLKKDNVAVTLTNEIPVIGGGLTYNYYECVTTFNFQWGKKVNYVNPVQYVTNCLRADTNNKGLTDAQVRALAGDLNSLQEALNNQQFKITLTPNYDYTAQAQSGD